ncbi:MAG: SMC-Scp complex subunit ScpB [Acidobacteriaceae bacterium]
MGLKAQIEAIIYAAEDPVTLEQLVTLLKEDILLVEQQGSRDAEGEATEMHAAEAELPQLSDPRASADATGDPSDVEDAAEADDSDAPEGELLRPSRARREEAKRHKLLVKTAVEDLLGEYQARERGIEIRELAGGFRMSTKPEHHDLVRSFAQGMKPPIKLSLPALETLAVIAYKQPVTAPEISEIRGVDTSGVLASLLGRKLITTAGRKQVVGRPILYKTTKEFLLRFGLKDVNELPSMEEFAKLSSQADMFDTTASETAAEAAGEARDSEDHSEPEVSAAAEEPSGNI